MTTMVTHFRTGTVLTLALTLFGAGCSLGEGDATLPSTGPALIGPSELALSVTLTATPDVLPRDGSSQSVVTLTVRDAQGRPVAGQRLTLGVSPSTAALSESQVTTDSAGRASFAVTAPPAGSTGNFLTITATPVGTDFDNAVTRFVTIALTGASNTTAPTPSFTVTPTSPEVNQVTTLDASATTDEGVTCGSACTYSWDLGGEATRTGRIITYLFQAAKIYNVALTVTDTAGTTATTRSNVTVTAAARPTVSFTVAPASPVAGQTATFTATVTVAANHRITKFNWTWGDGSTSETTNASINHSFSNAGPYVVTVTVTDDLGQTASASNTVTIGGAAVASFTFSPTNPKTTDDVFFNGVASTGGSGASITEWTWDFGDGSNTVTESDATPPGHKFPAARTYVVRLTVKDSAGRTGTTTKDVAVAAP